MEFTADLVFSSACMSRDGYLYMAKLDVLLIGG